jgi:hypothetical protein
MYDSRSSHPRGGLHWGRENRKDGDRIPVRPNVDEQVEIREGVLAYLDEQMSARVDDADRLIRERAMRRKIERAHAEAIRMDATQHMCFDRDCGLPDWECVLVSNPEWWALDDSDDEGLWRGDGTPNMNTLDDCWMPLVTLEQAREHFGRDFLGNGFHIDSHNVERRG